MKYKIVEQNGYKYSILFDKNNLKIIECAKNKFFEPRIWYELNQQAQELSLIQEFQEFLCFPSLKNIEKYPYQVETVSHVLRRFKGRALLCDEVGLGKTIEAGIILKEYIIRGLVKKVLILTPPSLVSQWKEEMATKFGLEFVTHKDDKFKMHNEKAWQKFGMVIASLNTAKSEQNSAIIKSINYDIIIVDEAHHLKSRATLNWQFVNELNRKFILLLTATPVQNDLEELFNMITLLKPGQLRTLKSFKKQYVVRGDKRKPKNIPELRGLLNDCMIRNTRSQVEIKLPKRHARTIKIMMDEEEKNLYTEVSQFVKENHPKVGYHTRGLNKFVLHTLQMEIGSSVQAVIPTLEKIYLNPENPPAIQDKVKELLYKSRLTSVMQKGKTIIELVKTINDKVIIFTKFLATQNYLHDLLTNHGFKVSTYHGGLSTENKEQSISLFENENDILISTEVGGEGRNLQFCNTMVNYDLPWNPMKIEQRIGRIHRIGQTREVFIYNLSAEDTVESYILKLLDEKINMFELVIGEMDMILGNLGEEKDFSELIMDIWIETHTLSEVEKKMELLGNKLVEAKEGYLKTKEYDEMLFGDYLSVE